MRRVETLLDEIDAACAEPVARHVPIRAIRYEPTPSRAEIHLPFGVGAGEDDLAHLATIAAEQGQAVLDLMRDPVNLLGVLHEWAFAWADHLQSNWAGSVTSFLRSHLIWAGNNPELSGWADFTIELRKVRTKLQHLTGLAPNTHPRPCIHCGGRIVQDQTASGLDDRFRCRDCGWVWPDAAAVAFAELEYCKQAPISHPELLVTVAEACAALPGIRRGTLNVALHRDRKRAAEHQRMPVRGHLPSGDPLYRLGDIADTLKA